MAHTYTCLYYHIVFGTKHRQPYLSDLVQRDLWPYLGGIARENDMIPLAIGGYTEHAHLLLRAKPTLSVSRMLQVLKGGSSWWIHQTFPLLSAFAWQDGYGAFTVGEADVEAVQRYIDNQREHHRWRTFQEEYLKFLQIHNVAYDPRYVWD